MKFELTMKGGMQTRPPKSSNDVYPPVVHKPKILLNNAPSPPTTPNRFLHIGSTHNFTEPVTKIATKEFLNTGVTSTFTIPPNFG